MLLLTRLRANGWKFTYEDEAADINRRKSNPIIAFLEDKCKQSDGYVPKSDLIAAYNEYAKKERLPLAPSKKAFSGMMMDQTAIPVDIAYPIVGGRQIESWSGIKLKETA